MHLVCTLVSAGRSIGAFLTQNLMMSAHSPLRCANWRKRKRKQSKLLKTQILIGSFSFSNQSAASFFMYPKIQSGRCVHRHTIKTSRGCSFACLLKSMCLIKYLFHFIANPFVCQKLTSTGTSVLHMWHSQQVELWFFVYRFFFFQVPVFFFLFCDFCDLFVLLFIFSYLFTWFTSCFFLKLMFMLFLQKYSASRCSFLGLIRGLIPRKIFLSDSVIHFLAYHIIMV